MIEPLFITLFPSVFLIALFGGWKLFRRKNIDIVGNSPIGRMSFSYSKYLIVLLWMAMVVHSWGINLSFMKAPVLLKWVALCSWVSGFLMLFIGRFGLGMSFRIGNPKESTNLTVDGVFRLTRNPIYVGVYGTLLAVVCYTLNPIFLVISIYLVVLHHKIILSEEEYLQTAFGEQYKEYCGRVRRYL